MESFRRGELGFEVSDCGPADGPVVVLLHGFPQMNNVWDAIVPRLTAMGYRCLAPNQRGYSPGARPRRRRDYRMSELVDDVGELIEASGADRVHLVGHDWGGLVAWSFAAQYPGRLVTLSALSSPHPAALLRSMMTSRQGLAWQAYLFQLPLIPEWLFAGSSEKPTGYRRYCSVADRARRLQIVTLVRLVSRPPLALRSTGTEGRRFPVASAG